MSSIRRIASNLLWQKGTLLRNPLVTLDPAGRVVSVDRCDEPDRMAYTEFWPGVLVLDFPENYTVIFDQMMRCQSKTSLPELLAKFVSGQGIPVVISGLNYNPLSLTSRAQIRSFK